MSGIVGNVGVSDSRVVCGNTEWRSGPDMKHILQHASDAQAWRLGERYTTIKVGKVFFRHLFEPPEVMANVVNDALAAGLSLSFSSWAGVWRNWKVFPPPLPSCMTDALKTYTDGNLWRTSTPYPWIEQRAWEGVDLDGAWIKYDIRSAYAWASSLGLPDMRTMRQANLQSVSDTAVYLCEGIKSEWRDVGGPVLPSWIRHKRERSGVGNLLDRTEPTPNYWILGETCNRLLLRPQRVMAAYEWQREVDLRGVLDSVREKMPRYWKCIYRAHWGDWGMRNEVVRETWRDGKLCSASLMPSGLQAPLWSWCVQGRVADRVSEIADDAQRIFIDAAVIPAENYVSNIGDDVGCWRIDERFDNGIRINPLPRKPSKI